MFSRQFHHDAPIHGVRVGLGGNSGTPTGPSPAVRLERRSRAFWLRAFRGRHQRVLIADDDVVLAASLKVHPSVVLSVEECADAVGVEGDQGANAPAVAVID